MSKLPSRLSLAFLGLLILSSPSFSQPPTNVTPAQRWFKGNLHTHSLWSDGDDYPEMVAAWYKDHGYHFLALSDHNVLLEGERWISSTNKVGGGEALSKYRDRFGTSWVQERVHKGSPQVRLKPLPEFKPLLEEPGRFLLIPSSEITDRHLTAPVHINATNLRDPISAKGGSNVLDVIQRNVNAVLAQREKLNIPMFPHINHPNFGWGITAEELMRVHGEQFFEVYNGHPTVHNDGDATHAGMERAWDIILAWRLAILRLPPMFGLAVDDSHHYHTNAIGKSNTGRGWIVARASHLTPESIVRSLEAGDFYASTGVTLVDVERSTSGLKLQIQPEPNVSYKIQFVGTRRNFDRASTPIQTASGETLRVTRRYSPDIGVVLAESSDLSASYPFKGDELYVRAKIISSRKKQNGSVQEEFECAWTQPALPASSSSLANTPAERLITTNRPLVIAHRGYSSAAPENTLPAFELALNAGADLVELDYHHSKDGTPFVIHDGTADRTTDATSRWNQKDIRIDARTDDELRQLQAGLWFKPPHPDVHLPTLVEALDVIQKRGVTLIERKGGDAKTLADLLKRRNQINQVIVQSFDWEYLTALHQIEPQQILGALGPLGSRKGVKLSKEEKHLNAEWLSEVAATGASAVVWNNQVDKSSIRLAHELGLRVWIYTIDDESVARSLLDAGADAIITNNPSAIWRAIAARSTR